MNIGFVGYRNSGKSTLAAAMEKELARDLLNTDKLIEEQFLLPIPGIIEQFGWKAFRLCERLILEQCCLEDNRILDFGGGVILHENELARLKRNTYIIYLEAGAETLYGRSLNNYVRPALTDCDPREEIEMLLKERVPRYRQYSDFTVNTENLTISQCKAVILGHLIEQGLMSYQRVLSKEKKLCANY